MISSGKYQSKTIRLFKQKPFLYIIRSLENHFYGIVPFICIAITNNSQSRLAGGQPFLAACRIEGFTSETRIKEASPTI